MNKPRCPLQQVERNHHLQEAIPLSLPAAIEQGTARLWRGTKAPLFVCKGKVFASSLPAFVSAAPWTYSYLIGHEKEL